MSETKASLFFCGCEGEEVVFAMCSRAWKYTEYRLILVQVLGATRRRRKNRKRKTEKQKQRRQRCAWLNPESSVMDVCNTNSNW